ncbi:MAG: transferrin-binding protein-like solute binding protein [Pseudomonadota bacterium]
MKARLTKALLISTVTLSAACSSGGSGDGAGDPGLFFGSTDPLQSANGLAFASDGDDLENIVGQDVKIRLLKNATRPASGGEGLILSDEVVNVIDFQNFTITIDGEDIEFVNGAATGPDGEDLRVFSSAQSFVQRLTISENANGLLGDTYHTIVGLETNPATIDAMPGSVTYNGSLFFTGSTTTNQADPEAAFLRGTLSLTADFAGDSVHGNGNAQIFPTSGVFSGAQLAQPALADVAFDIAPTAITGNGFVADLNLTSCGDGATCASNSEIGGVFFGPEANEVAGLATIDVTITQDNEDSIRFEGGGSFAADQPCNCD